MAKKNTTELVFILDRSGSMGGLESDTIGGYNSLLKKQANIEGDAVVTTVLFDDVYELLHDRIPIEAIKAMTAEEYFVRGSTALLDAIGLAINKIISAQKNTIEEYRAEKTLIVIITDGQENASREYSLKKVRSLIEAQKQQGWEFIFLGANIDALETAESFGIGAERAANFHADSAGTELNYAVLSEEICNLRSGKPLKSNWKKKIDADYAERKRR